MEIREEFAEFFNNHTSGNRFWRVMIFFSFLFVSLFTILINKEILTDEDVRFIIRAVNKEMISYYK